MKDKKFFDEKSDLMNTNSRNFTILFLVFFALVILVLACFYYFSSSSGFSSEGLISLWSGIIILVVLYGIIVVSLFVARFISGGRLHPT